MATSTTQSKSGSESKLAPEPAPHAKPTQEQITQKAKEDIQVLIDLLTPLKDDKAILAVGKLKGAIEKLQQV